MKFLVDEQLPLVLARAIASAGYDAAHVFDHGLRQIRDELIWRRVCEAGWTIITKDSDFVRLQRAATPGIGRVLWVRLPNCRNRVLLDAVLPAMPTAIDLLERGNWIVEIG